MTYQPSVKFVARVSAIQQRGVGGPAFPEGGGRIATPLVFLIHVSYMQLKKSIVCF